MASLSILVGGRMAEQHRRVGLLKAVGSTPALVAAILWAEYLAVALVAAVVGIVVGRLAAPLLTNPGAGLLGTAGAPQLSAANVGLVLLLAVAVATFATLVPALRAARTSTVEALTDTARQPRRQARLIALSTRLPVPWLLAARTIARRPRRFVLGASSIAVTLSGIVAVLFAHATVAVGQFGSPASNADYDRFDVGFISQTARVDRVLSIIAVMLVVLAAANVVFVVRSTIQDTRHSSAIGRALGATPEQLAAGLSLSQVAPSLLGAVLGIAGGYGMFTMANQGGSIVVPAAWTLVTALVVTVVVVAGLTAISARVGGRVPVAEVLRSDDRRSDLLPSSQPMSTAILVRPVAGPRRASPGRAACPVAMGVAPVRPRVATAAPHPCSRGRRRRRHPRRIDDRHQHAVSCHGGLGERPGRCDLRRPDPHLRAEISSLERRFGAVELIENQTLSVPGSVQGLELRAQGPRGPFGRPMLALPSGRLPSAPDEVALSPAVASAYGVTVGDPWHETGATRRVVGIVETPARLGGHRDAVDRTRRSAASASSRGGAGAPSACSPRSGPPNATWRRSSPRTAPSPAPPAPSSAWRVAC
jgi:hypothetical protein